MGIIPLKLIREVDQNFYAKFNEIQNIPIQRITKPLESSTKFCARCGAKNKIHNKFCIQCASKFEY